MTTYWIAAEDLDGDQIHAADTIDPLENFLLIGPAGSGKTNIILLRAKQMAFLNRGDFRIVVFTASLKNFIRQGCEQYGVPESNVVTATTFFRDLLHEYKVDFTSMPDFEAERQHLAGLVTSLIDSRGLSDQLYPALYIDEAQDYTDTELLIFRKLTKTLVLVADNRQSIYRNSQTPDILGRLVNQNIIRLNFHYRTGTKICRVADAIYSDKVTFPDITPYSKYDEDAMPSSITMSNLPSFDLQISKIVELISGQLDLYPGEKIGVLFPKRDQRDAFLEAIKFGPLDDNDQLWVDTIHGSKGLEFRAVHIAGCEVLSRMGPAQKRLIYTGVLRGKTAVSLYYSGVVPPYLTTAMAALKPPARKSSFSDLFKR